MCWKHKPLILFGFKKGLQGHRENIAAGHSRFVVLRGFENLHKFSAYTF
jgi:hypothetical protein